MCGYNLRFDPVLVQGSIAAVLEVGCRLLFIAERRETLRLRGDARGCNGHRRRRMVKTTTYAGYDARRVCAEDSSQPLFLKYSWNCGMPPGLTTLDSKI